jgi:hypothetical protein
MRNDHTRARLRRRQRRESFFIAILALALTCDWFIFRAETSSKDGCIAAFVRTQQQTSKIRSRLVGVAGHPSNHHRRLHR